MAGAAMMEAGQAEAHADHPVSHYDSATPILAFHITSVLSICGIVGNILSIFVLLKANSTRRCPLFTILSALCLVDAVFIMSNFVLNVLSLFYEYYPISSSFIYQCYLHHGYMVKYLAPVCFIAQLASIYLTLLVSYERWNAVCRPLSIATGSGRLMRRNICLVVLLSIVYNLPKFFEVQVEELPLGSDIEWKEKQQQVLANSYEQFGCQRGANCVIVKHSFHLADWLQRGNCTNWYLYEMVYSGILYTVFYFVIPVSAITYMNFRIAQSLRRSIKAWRTSARRSDKEAQLTYVSLAIVVSFYLFMLPNVLLTILDIFGKASRHHPDKVQLAVVATNFLVLINSCLNFILYCVIGNRFRQSLRDIICCCCHGDREAANQRALPLSHVTRAEMQERQKLAVEN